MYPALAVYPAIGYFSISTKYHIQKVFLVSNYCDKFFSMPGEL